MPHIPSAPVRGWQPSAPTSVRRINLRWLLPAAVLALCVVLWPRPAQPDAQLIPLAPAPALPTIQPPAASLPECVRAVLPGEAQRMTVPTQHLERGRMLLIDEGHPLPDGFTPADTYAVLEHTHGRVACRDLAAVSGADTLAALSAMLTAALQEKHVQPTVFAATRSREQQRLLLTDTMADLSRDMPLEDALRLAREAVASPDCSEHQTSWAVDVRICPVWNGAPEGLRWEDSAAGQWIIRHCWEYGFIRRWPDAPADELCCRAWHLRYVGRAHAMIMHALDATFEEYLALLHQHGVLTLYDENNAPLAAAVCVKAGEHQTSFMLPEAEVEDLSLDNTGWAVASCLFSAPVASP